MPQNLPIQRSRFIGRERELSEVRRRLRATPLLTLTGPGGCGKTRLAQEAATGLGEAFPDGIWLVPLAGLAESALVPQALAVALGVREAPGRNVPLEALIVERVAAGRTLILLDNCEHLLEACAFVAETLLERCPHLRLLVTSREPLRIAGETVWQVQPLTTPPLAAPGGGDPEGPADPDDLLRYEAVRLFVDRARGHRPGFRLSPENAAAVTEICHRLDGIPLALELAAARVGALSSAQIAARLGDRFSLLTGGSRTSLPRHRTLKALVDWSYDLLGEGERILWRRLSVFAGGFTLELAEAVCADAALPPEAVLTGLAALVEKSLVLAEERGGEVRYRLLETLREYGSERLAGAAEAESVRRRHRDAYLALAERAAAETPVQHESVWFDRLEAEHDNLRAALEWSKQAGRAGSAADTEAALRLAGALGWFWALRGHTREGRDQLARVLALPGADAPSLGRARALDEAGRLELAYVRGDRQAARAFLEGAVAIARRVGDHRALARALAGLGQDFREAADYPRAAALYGELLALSRAAGDESGIATALYYLGVIARMQGDRPGAAALYEESLAIRRRLGTRHGIAEALRGLGDLARMDGLHRRATRLYLESLKLTAELRDLQCSVGTLEGLALVTAAQGLAERSIRLFAAAAALRRRIGAPQTAARQAEMDAGLATARRLLSDAAYPVAWAEGGAWDLDQAVGYALADYPQPPDAARPSYPHGLTVREVEVIGLVARGLTDRQIAGELFISPKTVDHHLRRIFRKVQVANRAGLAAYAQRQGLAGEPAQRSGGSAG